MSFLSSPPFDLISTLPTELKITILSYLPLSDLTECCLVSKAWCDLVYRLADPAVWEQALIDHHYIDRKWRLGEVYYSGFQWIRLYETNPFRGNLLQNVNFERGKECWYFDFDDKEGEKWIIESPIGGLSTEEEVVGEEEEVIGEEEEVAGEEVIGGMGVLAGMGVIENTINNNPIVSNVQNVRCSKYSMSSSGRYQYVRWSSIPLIEELFTKYDVYLKWSVWVAGCKLNRSRYRALVFHSYGQIQELCCVHDDDQNWKLKECSVQVEWLNQGQGAFKYFEYSYGTRILNPTLRLHLELKQ